jgi:ABC-type multidrug transport system ATPase subunit
MPRASSRSKEDLTVEENPISRHPLRHHRRGGYDSIKAIYSQIERFKDRKAGALSGGMKQKLALSCALVHQPKILLLDEPTTGVDPISRKELWDMLGMLKQQHITIVAATPYLDEIRRCERVAFLNKGRVAGIGTADDILTQFKEVFNPAPLPSNPHPETDEPVIEVRHPGQAFGSFHAVDDNLVQRAQGEIFGFLGANGAGKTTAMHMLTGLNQPTIGARHGDGVRTFSTRTSLSSSNIGIHESALLALRRHDRGREHPPLRGHLWHDRQRDQPQDRRGASRPRHGGPAPHDGQVDTPGLEAEAGLLGEHLP